MSLKGRGQGVELGTSTFSLNLWIISFFLGLEFPYEPLNRFPLFVLLSPLPHTIASEDDEVIDDDEEMLGLGNW